MSGGQGGGALRGARCQRPAVPRSAPLRIRDAHGTPRGRRPRDHGRRRPTEPPPQRPADGSVTAARRFLRLPGRRGPSRGRPAARCRARTCVPSEPAPPCRVLSAPRAAKVTRILTSDLQNRRGRFRSYIKGKFAERCPISSPRTNDSVRGRGFGAQRATPRKRPGRYPKPPASPALSPSGRCASRVFSVRTFSGPPPGPGWSGRNRDSTPGCPLRRPAPRAPTFAPCVSAGAGPGGLWLPVPPSAPHLHEARVQRRDPAQQGPHLGCWNAGRKACPARPRPPALLVSP